jgi:transposase InsO family protein
MCEVLRVSESAFYEWKAGKSTKRIKREEEIKELVKKTWEDSRYTYGSPRVWAAIKAAQNNPNVSKSLIARVMKKYGFHSCHKKKFKVTTDSKHSQPVAENILNREFNAVEPAKKWVSDITYIWTLEGWLYLTTVIDLYDRKVVGWSLSTGMTTQETVVKALRMAIINRPISSGLLFHSDRGIQYASEKFRNVLEANKMIQSMSRKGNCWDNAVAESFFKTLKKECVYQYRFNTRKEAELVIFDYIESFYNQNRYHSTIKKTIKEFSIQQKEVNLAA